MGGGGGSCNPKSKLRLPGSHELLNLICVCVFVYHCVSVPAGTPTHTSLHGASLDEVSTWSKAIPLSTQTLNQQKSMASLGGWGRGLLQNVPEL